jgi:phenylpyruvate tautomerase PptA (4-oxalocrotonate tautomerase family)
MAQFKIYGREEYLRTNHLRISDLLHAAAVRTLKLPSDKRFHRFLPLAGWQLVTPADRSESYLIIEVIMFTGRSSEARKAFLRTLMEELSQGLSIGTTDIEITILEAPRENWGIRGQCGDELVLNYKVEI